MAQEHERVQGQETKKRPGRLTSAAFWTFAGIAICPYLLLLANRHLELIKPNKASAPVLVAFIVVSIIWTAFPVAFAVMATLSLVYRRRTWLVLTGLCLLIFLPYWLTWSQPVRGELHPAPWYSTLKFIMDD